jgi:hypothetical protein
MRYLLPIIALSVLSFGTAASAQTLQQRQELNSALSNEMACTEKYNQERNGTVIPYGGIPEDCARIYRDAQIRIGGSQAQAQQQTNAQAQSSYQAAQAQDARVGAEAQAHASPAMLAYEKRVAKRAVIEGQAMAVLMCQLRSDGWYETISLGVQIAFMHDPEVANFSPAEKSAIDHEMNRVHDAALAQAAGPALRDCATLADSPTMEKLDQLQTQLSGGYH